MWATLVAAVAIAYQPLDQVRLDCDLARPQYGSSPGVLSVPGKAVEITGNASAAVAADGFDPIAFGAAGPTIVCAGHIYVDSEAPRFCTAGEITAVWACPDPTNSALCWTQTATTAKTLRYDRHYAVLWPRGSEVAVTFAQPDQFSDLQGMLACGALLAIALALKTGVHKKLAVNWACAIVPLVGTQHAIVMQPPWTLALLTAAATAIALNLYLAKDSVVTERRLKPIIMAAIAVSLPHHAIGIHATLLTRLVIGLGICVVVGAWPTVSNVLIAVWTATVLIRPIVMIAAIEPPGSVAIELKTASIGATAVITGHLARHTLLTSSRGD